MVARPPQALQYAESAIEMVGKTPLVRLNRVMDDAPCLVLAKVEYVNPGGSVKDRPAVCRQISGPVDPSWASGLWGL